MYGVLVIKRIFIQPANDVNHSFNLVLTDVSTRYIQIVQEEGEGFEEKVTQCDGEGCGLQPPKSCYSH